MTEQRISLAVHPYPAEATDADIAEAEQLFPSDDQRRIEAVKMVVRMRHVASLVDQHRLTAREIVERFEAIAAAQPTLAEVAERLRSAQACRGTAV